MASDEATGAAPSAGLAPEPQADAPGAELAAVLAENANLLLQLHQVQEELEDEHRRLGPRPAAAARAAAHLLDLHDQGPHRHLDLSVRLAAADAEADAAPKLRVRLLNHHGRPGLAMLAKHSGELPLVGWQPTGHEGGRGYMLLVPSDDQGRARLQHLGASDWQRVLQAARSIRELVCRDDWELGAHWQATAARLCRQLADLPPRWRYDALDVGPAGAAGAPTLELCFGNASYGERLLGDVRLRWQLAPAAAAGASASALHWLRPERPQRLALGGWPVDEAGTLQPSFALPVGGDPDARARRRQWEQMPAADRELILAMLDALPGAADRVPADRLPAGSSPAALRRQAAEWHKAARRAVIGLRLRGTARSLLGRTSLRSRAP